ncbi:MAG: class I SAM-dependent methyltransferase, partial [Myxococcota bacterium]
ADRSLRAALAPSCKYDRVMRHDWNEHYAAGNLPWDTGEPDEHLVRFVRGGGVAAGRALEIGCGTGTNGVWLAEQGFSVLGVDVSPLAVTKANARLADRKRDCRFEVRDFLTESLPEGPFAFVFDRGCFHVFDDAATRERFAERVAALLAPGAVWLSLIGSTEGPPREEGPPRRSARDVTAAIEPALEIVELRATVFETTLEAPPEAWFCLARRRSSPAQPSTRLE